MFVTVDTFDPPPLPRMQLVIRFDKKGALTFFMVFRALHCQMGKRNALLPLPSTLGGAPKRMPHVNRFDKAETLAMFLLCFYVFYTDKIDRRNSNSL